MGQRFAYFLRSHCFSLGQKKTSGVGVRQASPFFFPCLFVGVMLLFLSACSKNKEPITETGFYFDTVISVTLYDPSEQDALKHCFALADKYERYFSDTISDSDISKINASAHTPVKVHKETLDLIEKGLSYSKESDGAFDITVGKLSDLWDFSSEEDFSLPDPAEVERLAASLSYENVVVDRDAGTVMLDADHCAIDLGGIAKGYIADQMKEYLEKEGITSGLINLGGNVLALGSKPDGSAYTIGIQRPFAEDGDAILKLHIKDKSVVTSGTYQRYAKIDDKIFHHILDTQTGYPIENGLSSVTVITDRSVDGDALSTTLFTMGLKDGLAYANGLSDTDAIFITTDEKIYYTDGYEGDVVVLH